jgi:transcriptional regulator with XRE-family HTH domain
MSDIMVMGMDATMPRSKVSTRQVEEVKNPRPRNGNTYAVGAYLQKLRDERGIHREPLVRQILADWHGNITMSNSTLVQIEHGKNKSVSAATIDAVRKAVGGDPYDISELWRLPIPNEDDYDAIRACQLEGERRAIVRRQVLNSGSAIRVIAENAPADLQQILDHVAKDESLRRVAKELANDPKALKMVLAILSARENGSSG